MAWGSLESARALAALIRSAREAAGSFNLNP
jgi:hypothetical protein